MTATLYRNPVTGHTALIWEDGTVEVNGRPAPGNTPPAWVRDTSPEGEFGPLSPWTGGPCPVSPSTNIIARFRARFPYIGPAIWPAHKDPIGMWRHHPERFNSSPQYDIVAYQVQVS